MANVQIVTNLQGQQDQAIVDSRQYLGKVAYASSGGEVAGDGAAFTILCSIEVPAGKCLAVTDIQIIAKGTLTGYYAVLFDAGANNVGALATALKTMGIPLTVDEGKIITLDRPFIIDNRQGTASRWAVLAFGGDYGGVAGAINAVTEFMTASMQAILE